MMIGCASVAVISSSIGEKESLSNIMTCPGAANDARRRTRATTASPLQEARRHGCRGALPRAIFATGIARFRGCYVKYPKGPARFMSALPPATLEGWYSLHQAFTI